MLMTEVGRVAALWRYPVKSMAAEALEEVEVAWHGLAGDRRWAFIRDGVARSGFPWMTIRERSDMGHYRPSFADPARPDASRTVVRTPAGDELEVVDPALAAELGDGVRVIKQNRGVFDAMPLSLITTQTSRRSAGWSARELDPQRFRPNLLIEAAGEAPFQEEAWVGSVLRIGGMRMRVDQRDERCVIVNVDPVTTERDPAVLRTLAREREACAGVYGSTVVARAASRSGTRSSLDEAQPGNRTRPFERARAWARSTKSSRLSAARNSRAASASRADSERRSSRPCLASSPKSTVAAIW